MNQQKKNLKLLGMLLLAAVMMILPSIREVNASTIARLNFTSKTVAVGEKVQLKVIGSKSKSTWKSSKKSVATVSKTVKVTAVAKGKTKITCTVGKQKLTCEIQVVTSIASEPNITLVSVGDYTGESSGEYNATSMELRNNGKANLTIIGEAIVVNLNEESDAKVYFLYDNKSEEIEYIEDAIIKPGKTKELGFIGDTHHFNEDTVIGFYFMYDGVKYLGCYDSEGNLEYEISE